ncbi:hypothetical protein B0H16DRAFT_1703092 [Mycena metata]|uniref:Uncharacterized protein n=1 Tax=Mycena metata TaxID=1033252 RepID=A0AAD7MDK6_9AGAR|nr:hypothetical protein B0H16DRAFT_1703092 [Mycena metata]
MRPHFDLHIEDRAGVLNTHRYFVPPVLSNGVAGPTPTGRTEQSPGPRQHHRPCARRTAPEEQPIEHEYTNHCSRVSLRKHSRGSRFEAGLDPTSRRELQFFARFWNTRLWTRFRGGPDWVFELELVLARLDCWRDAVVAQGIKTAIIDVLLDVAGAAAGRCADTSNSDNPFFFNDVSNESFIRGYVTVYRIQEVCMDVDLYNGYLARGLFDPDHAIGEPYLKPWTPATGKFKVVKVQMFNAGSSRRYRCILAKPPASWNAATKPTPFKDVSPAEFSTSVFIRTDAEQARCQGALISCSCRAATQGQFSLYVSPFYRSCQDWKPGAAAKTSYTQGDQTDDGCSPFHPSFPCAV